MILFYSGAEDAGLPQNVPDKSLGGYISSSPIQNGTLNNVFGTINRSDVAANKRDTRLIVIKNTTGAAVNNVKAWITGTDDSVSIIKMAAVAPALDECSKPYFEQISSRDALPFQGTLEVKDAEGNSLNIGTIAANGFIGIWLSRELIADEFPLISTAGTPVVYNEEYVALLQAQQTAGEIPDQSNLIIKWD